MGDMTYRIYTKPAELSKAVNTLRGILVGIRIDSVINIKEEFELINWCNLHRNLSNRHPFKEIIEAIDTAYEDGKITSDELADIIWICDNIQSDSQYYDLITSKIQELTGIFHGLLADNTLTDSEILNLPQWLQDNSFLESTYPFDEINSLLCSILSDGKIDETERKTLIGFLGEFVDTTVSLNINKPELDAIKEEYNVDGICASCPTIEIPGKAFCFTGTSSRCTRAEFQNEILSRGGLYHDTPQKKTDYLVVGNDSNPCWAFACYGRKVEKAIALRRKGVKIVIVHENDFWDELN